MRSGRLGVIGAFVLVPSMRLRGTGRVTVLSSPAAQLGVSRTVKIEWATVTVKIT